MRRTWMVLPAMLALLLAWPLMVSSMRAQSAARSASAAARAAGGTVTPAPPVPSAAPSSSIAVASSVAVATSAAAPATSVAVVVTHRPASATQAEPRPLPTMVMTPWMSTTMVMTPTVRPTTLKTTTPATTAPVTTKPATTAPLTTKPVTTKPVTTKPVTTKPSHTDQPVAAPRTQQPTGGTVTIANYSYAMPSSVVPGARIAIFDTDEVAHTLTIASAGIDVVTNPGMPAFMTAPKKPGHYLVTCDYHADMTATLVVS